MTKEDIQLMIPRDIIYSDVNEENSLNSSYKNEKSETMSTISQISSQPATNILNDLLFALRKCGEKSLE